MAQKSLRLDIDGVLVRDRSLLDHVTENCVKYVKSKIPDCKDPWATNRTLYLAHGHTARGLQVVHGVDTRDFNSKVYNKKLMNHLSYFLSSEEYQMDAERVYNLTNEGWNVSLFTNAPWIWAHRVGLSIGDSIKIKCPGNPADSPLKPEVEAYVFPFDHMNVIVDDSLKNLGTARNLTHWKCIHFTDQKEKGLWCPQVSSIEEMCSFVKNIS